MTAASTSGLRVRLHALNKVCLEDGESPLSPVAIEAAVAFAERHTDPSIVSADSTGAVYFSWGRELSMRFLPSGEVHWAGVENGKRPYGSGEPDAKRWACLRPNAEAPDQDASSRAGRINPEPSAEIGAQGREP